MDSNGVRILVDLLTLAHLHTSRATVPLQVKWIYDFMSYYILMFYLYDTTKVFCRLYFIEVLDLVQSNKTNKNKYLKKI